MPVRIGFCNRILAFLQSLTIAYLLNLMNFLIDEKSLIVDMGCGIGRVTRALSLRADTIGLDIDKDKLHWAKKCNKHITFVCCDVCHLPLRKASIDMAVCKSVFEHIENLEEALKEIKFVLKMGEIGSRVSN